MAYFELKADFALRPEVVSVRKNDVWYLLDLAQWIQQGAISRSGYYKWIKVA